MQKSSVRAWVATFLRGHRSDRPLTFWDVSRVTTALVLQFSALYIFAVAGLGIWSEYERLRDSYKYKKQWSTAEQRQSARDIARNCELYFRTREILSECIEQKIDEYQSKRDVDEDLLAQQDMAYWATWAVFCGVAALIVNVVSLFLLFSSLRQTRRAIVQDRQVGHAQVRAYISIDIPEGNFDITNMDTLPFHLIVKNTGQSPAYKLKYLSGMFVTDVDTPVGDRDIFIPTGKDVGGNVIAAGGGYQ